MVSGATYQALISMGGPLVAGSAARSRGRLAGSAARGPSPATPLLTACDHAGSATGGGGRAFNRSCGGRRTGSPRLRRVAARNGPTV
jgi:hypothetical protein